MKNLLAALLILTLAGCCEKPISKDVYYGTIKVPADNESKNGIIAFPVKDERRKAIVYSIENNKEFKKDQRVEFTVVKIKDILVARNIKETNNTSMYQLDDPSLIEFHNASDHENKNAHKMRHIVKGKWDISNVIGSDGFTYNIGTFNPGNEQLAIGAQYSLSMFWDNGESIGYYMDIDSTVSVNGQSYNKVHAIAKLHKDLPHD